MQSVLLQFFPVQISTRHCHNLFLDSHLWRCYILVRRWVLNSSCLLNMAKNYSLENPHVMCKSPNIVWNSIKQTDFCTVVYARSVTREVRIWYMKVTCTSCSFTMCFWIWNFSVFHTEKTVMPVYIHWSGRMLNFLSNFLQGSLSFAPAIIRIGLFWIVNTVFPFVNFPHNDFIWQNWMKINKINQFYCICWCWLSSQQIMLN